VQYVLVAVRSFCTSVRPLALPALGLGRVLAATSLATCTVWTGGTFRRPPPVYKPPTTSLELGQTDPSPESVQYSP